MATGHLTRNSSLSSMKTSETETLSRKDVSTAISALDAAISICNSLPTDPSVKAQIDRYSDLRDRLLEARK